MPTLYQYLIDLAPFFAANTWAAMLIAVAVPCLIVFLLAQAIAGASTYIERKVAADIQCRVGPNKCNIDSLLGEFARISIANANKKGGGLAAQLMATLLKAALPLLDLADRVLSRLAPGLMIFLADGIKLILKEDIVPDPVDKPLFKFAPTIVLMSAFGALAVLPYSDAWFVADFNIGVFYIAAVTSIEVLGILMAGWASNNKWALLGGMRSAAQIVSYELPVGFAILTGILLTGTMSMQKMTYLQLGWFWEWNVFHPAMFVLLPVYFLAALAECNRTPFDIPEAESELVSGYHTEYSGMRFAFFFMAEYIMMIATSAIAVTLFLGGWSTGIRALEHASFWAIDGDPLNKGFYPWATAVHLLVFAAKTYGLVFVMMWIRWTVPRYRVDQMMTLCWKKLIPLALFCFVFVAVWMLVRMALVQKFGAQAVDTVTFVLRLIFAVTAIGWLVWFFKRPLSPEQVAQREMLRGNPGLGTQDSGLAVR